MYTASMSGASRIAFASVCQRGTPWRRAKSSARAASRRITATSVECAAFWKAGPLLTSATSPQPMIPQRIVRGARLDTVKVQSAVDVNHLAGREREAAAHERRHRPRDVLGLAPARDRYAAVGDQP